MRKFTVNRHNYTNAVNEIARAINDYVNDDGEANVSVSSGDARTTEQNKKMWAMLGDISRQIPWNVDGRKQYISADDWKVILTAGLRRNTRQAEGIEGGVVLLGESTSKMTKKEFALLVEFIYFVGSEKGVKWSEAKKYIDAQKAAEDCEKALLRG